MVSHLVALRKVLWLMREQKGRGVAQEGKLKFCVQFDYVNHYKEDNQILKGRKKGKHFL
jgi:hypothetical protein